jgi:hypothetical protein
MRGDLDASTAGGQQRAVRVCEGDHRLLPIGVWLFCQRLLSALPSTIFNMDILVVSCSKTLGDGILLL